MADDIDDLDFAFDAKPSSGKKKRGRDLFNANGNDFPHLHSKCLNSKNKK